MSNYTRTANWLKACGKEPNHENMGVQIGCHLEEFAEFLKTLVIADDDTQDTLKTTCNFLDAIGYKLKKKETSVTIPTEKRVDALDALCDSEVTGNGIAYLANFNKDAADEAVLVSNEAKLINGEPVILPGGKIGKPEGWKPPVLDSFV